MATTYFFFSKYTLFSSKPPYTAQSRTPVSLTFALFRPDTESERQSLQLPKIWCPGSSSSIHPDHTPRTITHPHLSTILLFTPRDDIMFAQRTHNICSPFVLLPSVSPAESGHPEAGISSRWHYLAWMRSLSKNRLIAAGRISQGRKVLEGDLVKSYRSEQDEEKKRFFWNRVSPLYGIRQPTTERKAQPLSSAADVSHC